MNFWRNKWVAGGFVVAIIGVCSYWAGRKTAPTKTVTVTQTVTKEVTKWKTQVVKDTHEHKIIITHKFPDGTTVTKTTDDKNTDTKTAKTGDETTDQSSVSKTTSIYGAPNWRVGAVLGVDATHVAGGLNYGGRVERRILGPIWVGAEAFKSGFVAANVAIEF